jgi:hypothetical protein
MNSTVKKSMKAKTIITTNKTKTILKLALMKIKTRWTLILKSITKFAVNFVRPIIKLTFKIVERNNQLNEFAASQDP